MTPSKEAVPLSLTTVTPNGQRAINPGVQIAINTYPGHGMQKTAQEGLISKNGLRCTMGIS